MNTAAYSLKNKRIWIAGHTGLVGSAVYRRLTPENCDIITAPRRVLDLRDQTAVLKFLEDNTPDVIIIAAAKVGGIGANAKYPADFLYDNLMIETNIIHGAYKYGTQRLLFLGSSCIYPKHAENPIKEDALLTGSLEPTNAAYAIAKIAGIKLCEAYHTQYGCNFISAMPCNLYGPYDRFDPQHSHVIPALLMKAHTAKITKAKTLDVWGSGTPRREFLYVDDLADALVHVLQNYNDAAPINIGSGADMTIAKLAEMIAEVVGFDGDLVFDTSKPDGTMHKLMDHSKIKNLGWTPKTDLRNGLENTYKWYLDQLKTETKNYA